MPTKQLCSSHVETYQTVRLNVDTNCGRSSIRISLTDQRLTAPGGMIVWSHFLHQQQFRRQLDAVLPDIIYKPRN